MRRVDRELVRACCPCGPSEDEEVAFHDRRRRGQGSREARGWRRGGEARGGGGTEVGGETQAGGQAGSLGLLGATVRLKEETRLGGGCGWSHGVVVRLRVKAI